ncbi:PR-1-like protein [Penicillium angulare]|uniref:PR-1-like protein n=1 Tax=Penicillium angulare TaxID=116970 RepID=UPI00253FB0AD|nr:PR-1-like protein [Penicillium angulare]KAJ5291701.1 PR-1-like protein [Penicillium angulare]
MYFTRFVEISCTIALLAIICLAQHDCGTSYVTVTETETVSVMTELSMDSTKPTKVPTAPAIPGNIVENGGGQPDSHVTKTETVLATTELSMEPTEPTKAPAAPKIPGTIVENGGGQPHGHVCGYESGNGGGCRIRVSTYYSNSTVTGPTSSIQRESSSASWKTWETSIASSSPSVKSSPAVSTSASSRSAVSVPSAVLTLTLSHITSSTKSALTVSSQSHKATSTTNSDPLTLTVYLSSPTLLPTATTTFDSSTSSTSSTIATSAGTDYPWQGSYQDKVIYSHNIHRMNHSVPNLLWNKTLADAAYSWGARCQFRHNTSLLRGGYGQNLAASSPTASISIHISDYWYNNEMKIFAPYYGWPNPGESSSGHFSQIVWKDTASVGCATVNCRYSNLGMWYTVCNYYPPGNWGGEYGENVLVPIGNPTVRGDPSDIMTSNFL